MAKADILALVDFLLLKPDTSGEGEGFCDELIRELGFREFLTGTEDIDVDAALPAYRVAPETIRVLESHLANVGRLDPVSGTSLRGAYGVDWRSRRGTPYHLSRVDVSSDVVRLFPVPVDPDTLTIIRTEAPDCVPYWVELALALEILARLLARESAQKDIEMATAAKRIADFIWLLLKLEPLRTPASQTAGLEEG